MTDAQLHDDRPIKAVINRSGKQCDKCGAYPDYPHALICPVAYPIIGRPST